MTHVFMWIPGDMMGQVQKAMKYHGEKEDRFLEPAFCLKTPAFFTGTIWQVGSLGMCFSNHRYMYIYIIYTYYSMIIDTYMVIPKLMEK